MLNNASYQYGNTAYIASDGNYSASEDVLLFDADALTSQQWENLASLPDSDRTDYIFAILNDDHVNVQAFEMAIA